VYCKTKRILSSSVKRKYILPRRIFFLLRVDFLFWRQNASDCSCSPTRVQSFSLLQLTEIASGPGDLSATGQSGETLLNSARLAPPKLDLPFTTRAF
jgi:hypothetical protein